MTTHFGSISSVRRCGSLLRSVTLGLALTWAMNSLPVIAGADEKAAPAAKAEFEETWQAVYIGDSRVGYVRSTTERKPQGGRDIIISDSEMSLDYGIRSGEQEELLALMAGTKGDILKPQASRFTM